MSECKFEQDLKFHLAEKMKESEEFCVEVWSALANVNWYHPESHDEYGCSFRYAGGLIAEILGDYSDMNYMKWYCSGPYATVSDTIARAMKKSGWIADTMSSICDEPNCYEFAGCGWPTKDGGIDIHAALTCVKQRNAESIKTDEHH